MQYCKFGHLVWEGSAIGFGAMRLPVINDVYADVDEPEATPSQYESRKPAEALAQELISEIFGVNL